MRQLPQPNAVQKTATAVGERNVLVNLDIDAASSQFHVLDTVEFSYDGTPASAKLFRVSFLTAEPAWARLFQVYVMAAGLHIFRFPRGLLRGVNNESVRMTLPADNIANLVGTINCTYR